MEIYNGEFDIIVKKHIPLLTVADLEANIIICQGLKITLNGILFQKKIKWFLLVLDKNGKQSG